MTVSPPPLDPTLDPLALATDSQRRATTPGHSAWVEANAGTGKTKVLTDRVTRLLLDRVKPERILCLPSTKAAAAEIRNRLAGQLGRWAMAEDATLDEAIETLIDRAPEGGAGARGAARRPRGGAGGRCAPAGPRRPSAWSPDACSRACSTRRAASTS